VLRSISGKLRACLLLPTLRKRRQSYQKGVDAAAALRTGAAQLVTGQIVAPKMLGVPFRNVKTGCALVKVHPVEGVAPMAKLDKRDEELLDKQLWGVSSAPPKSILSSGLTPGLAIAAVFLAGIAVGNILFAQQIKPIQIAHDAGNVSISSSNDVQPILR
jgi:hypothetical protein